MVVVAVEVGAVEDVVAEHEGHAVVADEVGPDEEGLREAFRLRLNGVLDRHAQLAAVTEQRLELVAVLGRRDDEHLANARRDERRQRVVDHGLVVDGHELLRDALGDGPQPRAGAAGENDAAHYGTAGVEESIRPSYR